jgi:hypothetical protein
VLTLKQNVLHSLLGGEGMNKKIIVVFAALLFLAMFVAPVMAAPATKIEGVTMTVAQSGPPVIDKRRFVSDDTISHSTGGSSPGSTVTLTIPDVGTYSGDWHTAWIANGNYKIGEFIIISKNTMTFAEGTFEGVNQRRITGESPQSPTAIIEDYCVYKGTGMFKGWTLKITNDEGYVIIPK